MRFSDFITARREVLLACFAGGIVFTLLLVLFGLGTGELVLLWIWFLLIIISAMLAIWRRESRRAHLLLSEMEKLDQKHLFAEIADVPENGMEKVYFRLLREALKDMTDEVSESRRQNEEYREFVEQWVHEVKVPVTGIRLLCRNNRNDVTRKIMSQTERIEQDVERALFYARLGSAEKDCFIKELSLRKCVEAVLSQNRQYLIENGVSADTERVSHTVYSDEKWLCFILSQLLYNSVKYRSERAPVICMASQDMGNYISLSVTDNGIGIRESELGRVFEKGFVGSNGRNGTVGRNSTGLGLYLCEQFCERLGTGIEIDSEEGQYTTVSLLFPKDISLQSREYKEI